MGWLPVEWVTVSELAFTTRRLHSALFGEVGSLAVVIVVLAAFKLRLVVRRAQERHRRRRPVVTAPFTLLQHTASLDRVEAKLDPQDVSPN